MKLVVVFVLMTEGFGCMAEPPSESELSVATIMSSAGAQYLYAAGLVTDYNGDGLEDLYLHGRNGAYDYMGTSNGVGFNFWTWSTSWSWEAFEVLPGDFNGDRRTDLYLHARPGYGYSDYMAVSNGTGFDYWTFVSPGSWHQYKVIVGDYNGDGLSDIYLHAREGLGAPDYMGVASGNAFAFWTWTSGSEVLDAFELIAGDYNGDGKTDLLRHPLPETSGDYDSTRNSSRNVSTGGAYTGYAVYDTVAYAGGAGFVAGARQEQLGCSAWCQVRAGDFNGDGRSDVLYSLPDGQNMRAVPSRGADFATYSIELFGANGRYIPAVGDVDGDGRTDVYIHSITSYPHLGVLFLGSQISGTGWRSTALYPYAWHPFDVILADRDGNGRSDLYLHGAGDSNYAEYMGLSLNDPLVSPNNPFAFWTFAPGYIWNTYDVITPASAIATGERICTDGIDNDGDGRADCRDSDCIQDYMVCNEGFRTCADGIDNDQDGFTDCHDDGCHSTAGACVEASCSDRLDNDFDRLVDCADRFDCYSSPSCHELDCSDRLDSDADGFIDCGDYEDCGRNDACHEQLCDNAVDGDRDRLVDCADPDCNWSGEEPCRETRCADGYDDEGDGQADCADRDCLFGPACRESACADAIDSDRDGAVDCADDDCEWDDACIERQCTNGLDDNGNGPIDCADRTCDWRDDACVEAACNDGIDNNGNGLTDCRDVHCEYDEACWEPDCGDGLDNDNSGLADCADPHCYWGLPCQEDCTDGVDNNRDGQVDCHDARCAGCNERLCTDGIDNNVNGQSDCADRDCRWTAPCLETSCTDGIDNGSNGLIDCADPDCYARPGC